MLPEKGADEGVRVQVNILGGRDTAWAAALCAAAAGRASIVALPTQIPDPPGWQRILREALLTVPPAGPLAISGAGMQGAVVGAVEHWYFEDGSGQALFSPFFAAGAWQRPPYALTLRLVAQRGGRKVILAEACVGAREAYVDLLRQLARTAIVLLTKALSAPGGAAGESCEPVSLAAGAASRGALLGGALRRQLLRSARRLAVETWAVGIAERPIERVLASGELGAVAWLQWDDRQGYLADPFPWPGRADRFLCERYSNRTGIGDLVTIEGAQADRQIHIDIPERRHLSYPGTWLENGEQLLMPESGAARRTVIYRLNESAQAHPWVTVAENCGMADPTLFQRDGLYWIAYTDTDIGLHDNLCLLFAERLEGPWQRHPGNPVKLDIRSSRPAGLVFQVGEGWFRPAQDCAADYGAALAINRIVELSTTRFREEVVAVLRPDPRGPYPHGLHTLSVWGNRVLIDGKCWRRRPRLLLDKIGRRLRRTGDS